MEFNINHLSLSHNGQYIMYENTLYDVANNNTISLNSTDLNFWLTFLKENSEQSYKNMFLNFGDIQKIIRETVYNVSNFFSDREKDKFLIEFESKFSNNLIIENQDTENNLSNISNSWNFIIDKINILKEEESLFDSAVSSIKSAGKYVSDKVSKGLNFLKEKGLGWFFENLRKALFSWGGAAIQAFLATFTAGVGNVILVIVWGAMLAWDIYQGISTGTWDWANILIDIVGVVTTGPGAKIIGGVFQKLGILGSKLPLSGIIQKMSTAGSSTVRWFSSIIKKIVSGISQIGSYMLQGVSWLGKKLNIKILEKTAGQLKTKLNTVVDDIVKSSSNIKQIAGQKLSNAGTSIGKKLAPVGRAIVSKPGQVATAAGLTYGLNTAFGADNRAFAGAFGNDEGTILASVMNQPAEYSDEDLP
jgi:hypothetical protein